jgi:hypothetical protein
LQESLGFQCEKNERISVIIIAVIIVILMTISIIMHKFALPKDCSASLIMAQHNDQEGCSTHGDGDNNDDDDGTSSLPSHAPTAASGMISGWKVFFCPLGTMSETRRLIFERRLSLETDGSSMCVSADEATHCVKCGRVPLSRLAAYPLQPHCVVLSDNRFIEMLGRIEMTHGGGASMFAQTNDTDIHAHVRQRFIELQRSL